ncbi:MAG: hypothetical protein ACRDZ2_05460, partial [Ilumatobacteraceae bacterium]
FRGGGSSKMPELFTIAAPMAAAGARLAPNCGGCDPVAPGDSSGVGAFFPGGQPGSALEWYVDTVDEQPLHEQVWNVPDATEFLPVTWNPDLGAARAAGSLEGRQG